MVEIPMAAEETSPFAFHFSSSMLRQRKNSGLRKSLNGQMR